MEDVREKIAKIIYKSNPYHTNFITGEVEPWEKSKPYLDEADQILAIEVGKLSLQELIKLASEGRLEVRAENQDLPLTRCLPLPDRELEPYKTIQVDVPRHWDSEAMQNYLTRITQQDMLKGDKDTHWVKVRRTK